ncbi:MAG TPA: hypothetical protein VNI02_15895 [Blastocatellia bacterium]|jgi:hypothetical protein|nr:hypothetical protein [Blastocatellia bacterium]
MKIHFSVKGYVRLLLMVMTIIVAPSTSWAQGGAKIERVRAHCGQPGVDLKTCAKWEIYVVFTEPLTRTDEASVNKTNFSLINTLDPKKEYNISPPVIDWSDPEDPNGRMPNVKFTFDGTLEQEKENQLTVIAHDVSVGGKVIKEVLQVPVAFAPLGKNPNSVRETGLEEAEDRDHADLYLAGELARASGTDFTGSVDIKVRKRILKTLGRNEQGKGGKVHSFAPFFDLIGSSDPEADPDTMKFGLEWMIPYNYLSALTSGFRWKNIGRIESDRDFDNTNFAFASRLQILSRVVYPGETSRFFFKPFFGAEVGKNLKSPVREAEGRAIARLLFGTNFNLVFDIGDSDSQSIALESSYERRILLRREVGFKEVKDVGLVPVDFGTRPRDWAEAKLRFMFSKTFGGYIGYQWGELPPAYKLSNHQLKMGLIFMARIK